jgi:hypothetical protein
MMPHDETPFDPTFASWREWAEMYRANGLQIVPAKYPMRTKEDKRPQLTRWKEFQNQLTSDSLFDKLFPNDGGRTNFGIVTGKVSGNLLVVDLDIYKDLGADAWFEDALDYRQVETWSQRTGGGGRQIFFKLPDGVVIGNGANHALGVDIRGQGGFVICPPSDHLSGGQYAWEDGCAPWECDLADCPSSLIDAVQALGCAVPDADGGDRVRTPTPETQRDFLTGEIQDGRETHARDMIWAIVIDWRRDAPMKPTEQMSLEKCKEAFSDYLEQVTPRIDGPDKAVALEAEGRGWTMFSAKWRVAMRKWEGPVTLEAEKPRPLEDDPFVRLEQNRSEQVKTDQQGQTDRYKTQATPFVLPSECDIPMRQWVYGGRLIRGFVSATVSPGGIGKSSLTIIEALAMTSGVALLGEFVKTPLNVWVWNLEDSMDEMQRRIVAAAKHYNISPDKIAGRLYVDSGRVQELLLAAKAKNEPVINTRQVDDIIETMLERKIDVLIIDPFISAHRLSENDNGDIDVVVKTLNRIAEKTNSAIEVVHHSRKTKEEVTVDDARGASALLAAVRSARALNGMTEKEAEGYSVEERWRYFRAFSGKSNLAPRSDDSTWYKLESVTLDNGPDKMMDGDHVGVVTMFKPNGPFDFLSPDMAETIFAKIENAMARKDPYRFGRGVKAEHPMYAPAMVAEVSGCKLTEGARAIKEWIQRKVVVEEEFIIDRKPAKGLNIDRSKTE